MSTESQNHSQSWQERKRRLTEFSVEMAAEAMFIVSDEGMILSANRVACERLEYTHDELTRLHVADVDPNYPRESWPEHFQLLQTSRASKFESQHQSKSGRLFDVEISVAALTFDGQDYCCSTVRDITDRKQAEHLLRLQQEVLASVAAGDEALRVLDRMCCLVEEVVPQSLASVMLIDETDGRLRFGAGPRLTSELREAFEPLQPGPQAGSCGMAAFLKQPVIVTDTCVSPHWETMQPIIDRFGVRACWSIPILDDQDLALGTFAISHARICTPSDFHLRLLQTASHLASIALRRHRDERQLRFTQFSVDQAQAAIFWVRADGKFLYVNQAACESLGYTRDELLALRVFDIAPGVTPETWHERARKILALGHMETEHQRKDGTLFPVDIFANPLEVDGHQFYVAFVQDITQRKLSEDRVRRHQEELAHLNRVSTMGEMASSLAHELNQPLAAVVNYAQVLENLLELPSSDLDRLQDLASKTREQALRAGSIVSSLRNLMRKTTPAREAAEVEELIRKSLLLMEPQLRHNDVGLTHDIADLPTLFVDSIQIQQVLVNLIRNAIDAMRSTPPDTRHLHIAARQPTAGVCEICVIDSGPGINSEDYPHLFTPFQTTKSDGMGMGLAISRTIAKAHDGKLWADAAPGGGARFRLEIPVTPPPESV